MDPLNFHTTLEAIKILNASEGPASNIFEPKFEARRQAVQLRETIVNVYRAEASPRALEQLCQCLVFIGIAMMEVEEEKEGYEEVRRAYQVMQWRAAAVLPSSDEVCKVQAVEQDAILNSTSVTCSMTASSGYAGCVEYMAVHNALGLYLSKVDLSKAKTVLDQSEALYDEWAAWWEGQPVHCSITEVPLSEDGTLRTGEIAADRVAPTLLRFYMDSSYTATLFFMAQLHTTQQNTTTASQYCHRTMYYQLLNKQEFNRKSWATNALQLSGFYSSHFAYDKAFHCLVAGETLMPVSEDPEDAKGLVAWAFGRFYLHRLHHYGGLLTGREPGNENDDVVAQLEKSWRDFPGMPPLQTQPPIITFDEARTCFKEGIKRLQEAQACRPFESFCTEHIDIARDMVQLYAALQLFEPNRARRIAMTQHQAHLLEEFPDQLSFNAYPVVVRQLLYDLGSLYEDQMRMRVQQRKQPEPDEKPLKDKAFNAVVRKTLGYYERFCETWRHPTTHVLPDVLEEESRLPFFRALMRRAQVQLSYIHRTPKEEYDSIGVSCKAYNRAIEFYDKNPLSKELDAEVSKEVELAREMLKLLPAKQHNLWIAFQRNSA
ncbi:KIF-1 binding protein C terminal, putative [Leishmania lindenbergi]|uniref:KIF-binding protein n=1 Tax=Leishmania lindenbergi TaxID=651832 RepID=A0AAW3ACY5_9TRYP